MACTPVAPVPITATRWLSRLKPVCGHREVWIIVPLNISTPFQGGLEVRVVIVRICSQQLPLGVCIESRVHSTSTYMYLLEAKPVHVTTDHA